MDELDKKILNLLLDDGRLKYRQIAKKLKISTSVAFYRMKRLFDNGTIQKIVPILSEKISGPVLTAVILVNIENENLIDFESSIANNKSICAVYDITGEYDALIIGKFKDNAELDKFLKGLRTIKGVTRTYTSIVLNTIKEDFFSKGF